MTLDEAIKIAEEEAKEQDKLCKRYDDASGYARSHNEDIRTTDAKRCEKCAEEHRQLAEWLKDYKRLLEQEKLAETVTEFANRCRECGARYGKLLEQIRRISLSKCSTDEVQTADECLRAVEALYPPVTSQPKIIDNSNYDDILTVSFDIDCKLIDMPGLCVTRKCGEKTTVLKMELGEQAVILYHLLIDQMAKAEIKPESEDEYDKR